MSEETEQSRSQEQRQESQTEYSFLDSLIPFIVVNRRSLFILFLVASLAAVILLTPRETLQAMARAIFLRRSIIVLLLGLSVVILSLLWSAGEAVDQSLFLLFNLRGPRPVILDHLMWALTQVGNMVTALILAGFFYLAHYRLFAIEIVLGMISLWLVVESIKMLTERARPYLSLEARIVGSHARGMSFPSGHTSQTFFLMTSFVQVFHLEAFAAVALYILAVLVGITRMYVGAHYPRDVIAGGLLGTVWGILSSMLYFHIINIHP